MKVNFKYAMMAVAALTMGLTSCGNNEEAYNGGEILKGERTSMQFVITVPKAPTTYAPVDANATQNEIELKKVDVLIYEETGTGFRLEQIANLSIADFDAVLGTDKYKLKEASKIKTTTGSKKIFVAMNYNGTYPAIADPYSTELKATLSKADDLSNATTGFAMFSATTTDAGLVTEDNVNYPTANTKSIAVKRMVAKVSVQESEGLRTGGKILSQGGEFTNLQFTLGNINKTSYLLQNVVTNVVRDFNWSTYAAGDFFKISDYSKGSTLYRAVDKYDATIASGTIHPMYAPENTAEAYNENGDNLTYVSIRAQYLPEYFVDASGVKKNMTGITTPVSFWTVIRSNGALYYFNVESEATAFAASYTGSVKSDKYTDGICYFRGYLNQDGAADVTIAGSKAAKFDVLRNVYYKTIIKSIKAPGYATDMGKVTEATSLVMDVEVQPWQTHTDEFEL